MTITRQRLLVFLFPLFLALPFINRAYFVDDSYFVEIATWLKDHPAQPYHFRADDNGLQRRGWGEDGFVRMVNPLAHHYYLALLLKVGIEKEWFLRLGCILLTCFSALFIFELARRWLKEPLWATILVLVTPVHWLTSYSLLIDSTLGFYFFGGLYFFLKGTETASWRYFLLSGLFMGISTITKYPAVLIFLITFVWFVLSLIREIVRHPRGKIRHPGGSRGPGFIPFVKKVFTDWIPAFAGMTSWKNRMVLKVISAYSIGVGILIAYNLWTMKLYGAPHILAASHRMVQSYGWPKYLVFVIFFSGATLVPLVSWFVVDRKRLVLYGALGLVVAAIMFTPGAGFNGVQSALIGLWVATTLLFVMLFIKSYSLWDYPKDFLIATWIFGFILMMSVVMGWVAARYYMIVIPAIVFGLVRLIEMLRPAAVQKIMKRSAAAIFLFTACLAFADYKQAAAAKDIVQRLARDGVTANDHSYYLGDSFISSYLKGAHWTPCFPDTQFKRGDVVLSKEVTMPSIWFFRKNIMVELLGEWPYSTHFPLKVMDNRGSAGFYASVWGALPFTFSDSPWERFRLFRIVDAPKSIEGKKR